MPKFNRTAFEKMPIVGIMRNFDNEVIEKIVPVYIEAGLTTLEITMNSFNAEEMISKLAIEVPQLNIGAGTVCSMEDLDKALIAGASFIVAPIVNEEVIQYCAEHRIPIFPGAFTPSEVYHAWELGATAVKIFPTAPFGPSYIKELKGPLNHVKMLPTGGVRLDNIKEFFKSGACGVGMGGSLFEKHFIENNDYAGLKYHFKEFVKLVKEVQGETSNSAH